MSEALTDKQARFVQEYLVDGNGTQAAIRAGYSAKTADVQASRLLGNVKVAAAVSAGQAKVAASLGLSHEWVLTRLQSVAERCLQAEAVRDQEGKPTGEFEFNAPGANRALELLGKHLGMFKEPTGPASKINVAIENLQVNVVQEATAEVDELIHDHLARFEATPPFDA